ncbi:TIR domain-containing protein [Sphingomonas sp.]|uniref:TIR domain-containing protein n=1 Tax=Sphingomonas sp. TaxID=28214 RepID=UPI002DD66FF1|nr:TIR domain-containing protein [Sphingomonas sp.]
MANEEIPTVNDVLSRLYTIRDEAAGQAKRDAEELIASHSAKGLLRSGATLKALATIIENRFDASLDETFGVLRHMQSVPGTDYATCRDQAFLRARDLVPALRGATDLDKWLDMIGRGTATEVINRRVEGLMGRIDYRFRQFDVGLDRARGEPAQAEPRPEPQRAAPVASATAARAFQVALSFAGEQRAYVHDVAQALAARHVAVFYDEFQANALWGKDGAEHFHHVYANDAQYVVMFISAEYVAKAWTRQERRAAISRQMKDAAEYILPVRFDDSEVPGLPDTLQFLRADRFTPAQLAVEIAKKIGVAPTAGKASDVPPPASSALSGEVTFDYAAHNGRYMIGSGTAAFETAWSKASDASIHLMNDPGTIHGIAIARGAGEIGEVVDATAHDYSSRVRTVKTGEVAVIRNVEGFYAAVRVLKVEDDSRGAASDALTIGYRILADGGTDFSAVAAEGDPG